MATMSMPVQPDNAVSTKGLGMGPLSSPPTFSGASMMIVWPFTKALNCILPIHCVSISCCAMGIGFCFTTIDAKNCIQWTKADQTGSYKYRCNNYQYYSGCARDYLS